MKRTILSADEVRDIVTAKLADDGRIPTKGFVLHRWMIEYKDGAMELDRVVVEVYEDKESFDKAYRCTRGDPA